MGRQPVETARAENVEYVLRRAGGASLESPHVQRNPTLIPIIEAGLAASRFTAERAALMASFCEWTTQEPYDDPEAVRLAERVRHGLQRIKLPIAAR